MNITACEALSLPLLVSHAKERTILPSASVPPVECRASAGLHGEEDFSHFRAEDELALAPGLGTSLMVTVEQEP